MGITLSDTSSYVARSLFYDSIGKTNNLKFMATGDPTQPEYYYVVPMAHSWTKEFSDAGYNALYDTYEDHHREFDSMQWENQDIISYMDHGAENWAGIRSTEIPLLSNSYVSNDACSTCAYNRGSIGDLFCTRAIRRGAIGHAGAVSVAWTWNNIYMNILNGIYYKNMTMGQAYQDGFEYEAYKYQTTLIGDPTFHFNPKYLL